MQFFQAPFHTVLCCRNIVEQILEAANWAPTHGRTEPWRFVVLSPTALQEMIWITHKVCSMPGSNHQLQAPLLWFLLRIAPAYAVKLPPSLPAELPAASHQRDPPFAQHMLHVMSACAWLTELHGIQRTLFSIASTSMCQRLSLHVFHVTQSTKSR